MRGKKRQGRGKITKRGRGGQASTSSKGKRQEFEEDYEMEDEEAQNEPEMSVDPVEREGNIAFDLLTRKIQLRKLVDELQFKNIEDEEYPGVTDENSYSPASSVHEEGQRKLERSHKGKKGNGLSSKAKPTHERKKPEGTHERKKPEGTHERKKPEGKKDAPEVIEDEEVLRIIGELEKEVDTSFPDLLDDVSDAAPELLDDVSDAELNPMSPNEVSEHSNAQNDDSNSCDVKTDSIQKEGRTKIEISFEDNKDASRAHSGTDLKRSKVSKDASRTYSGTDLKQNTKVGGLVHHGPYSRILVVGDGRIKLLEKFWPEYAYVRPQFLSEDRLTLSDVKDFVLSCTELPHLENGTLLICSVGLHDIIDFTDYRDCHAIQDHQPISIMTLKEAAVEDIIKLVLMRLKKAYKVLEETLDSSSVVCFTAIIPCNPVAFFEREARNHTPEGHAIMSTGLRETLDILRDKIQVICDRVNKHLSKLSPMPSVWDIMSAYHLNRQIGGRVFVDGIKISVKTAEVLSGQLNKFFQELFYGMEISKRCIEFHRDHEVIVVGDSRLQTLQKVWYGDKPKFHCEPELGFFNFSKYIAENFVGLKNKIVVVCLGLNDLVQFIDDSQCDGKDHEHNKVAVAFCEKYGTVEEYMKKVTNNMQECFNTFCENNSSLLFFATMYPIHLNNYITSQAKAHKEKTGHDITPVHKDSQISEKLAKLLSLLNSHLRLICRKQCLPIWDMHHVVCRGNEESTLSQAVLKDGIYPSERTAEELVRSYFVFVKGELGQDCVENKSKYKFKFRPLPRYVGANENLAKRPGKTEDTKATTLSNVKPPADLPVKEESQDFHVRLPPPSELRRHPPPSEFRSDGIQKPMHHGPKPGHEFNQHRHPKDTSHPTNYYASRSSDIETRVHGRNIPVHRRRHSRFSRSPESNQGSGFSRQSSAEYPKLEERSRDVNYPHRSPERFYDSGIHRSPERLQRTRSPERVRKSGYSRSPERLYKSKYSRSPEQNRMHKLSRSPERGHRSRRDSHNSGDRDHKTQRHTDLENSPLDTFKKSIREIQRECHKEKDPIVRDALLVLCDTHSRECERYLSQPDKHPDYSRVYWEFIEKKKKFIIDLGGDPEAYDYLGEWGQYWPARMFYLFKDAWVAKKKQCISMMSSKRRKPSPSSSSSSTSSGSNRKRKRSKKKTSRHLRSLSPEPKKRDVARDSDKWKPLESASSDSRDDDFIRQIKPKKKIDIVLQSQVPDVATQSSHTSQKASFPKRVEQKSVKVVEVLGILAYMKDKLGVFGMPVSILYEKAVGLEKRGVDPNLLLEDEESAALLNMLSDKLTTVIEEGEGSAIQKAIIVEAQTLLKDLLTAISKRREKSSSDMTVNIGQIARLTMGKTIPETIVTIKNFLLYEGFGDLSRERLENIYMTVKDEQLKINHSSRQLRESLDTLSSAERFQRSELLSNPRTSHHGTNYLAPGDELTEEFFIGDKSFSKPGAFLKQSLTTTGASTSRFDAGLELDEEFFTGRKFMKPNFSDPVSNARTNDSAEKGSYVPRRHVLPPPPPVISGMHFARSSLQRTPSADIRPEGQRGSNLDFDMMRKCLATLKNIPK